VATEKSFSEKTSADDKSIGFEYQYYYFLDRLLNLKSGQSVGLEVKDDVHTDLDADCQLLFQLKHTVKKAAGGAPIALPELDVDLWKTLYNWTQIIVDAADGRSTISAQLAFVRKTEFHLVTNKSESKTNNFLALLEEFKAGASDFSHLKAALSALVDKTADATIKGYIAAVASLNNEISEQYFRRVFVELSVDDIIGRVKLSIRDKFIDPSRIDEVFARLDSRIREDNFYCIKAALPILIARDDFMEKYKNIFVDGRSKILPEPTFTPVLPDKIFAQLFIKRLIEIEAIDPSDTETALDYTTQKLRIARFLEAWLQTGDLLSDEVNAFHKEVFTRWRNKFQFAFKKCATPSDVVDKALELFVALREERFKVGPSELNTELSNGELYYLSDDGKIGWHRDWELL
jgi:hypothetical protein